MKHFGAILAAAILTAALSSHPAFAGTPQPATISIMHVASAPSLDRRTAWPTGSEVLKNAHFQDLTTNGLAPHATSVYIVYDDMNLYVKFVCEQNGTPITSNQVANDVGFGLDDFVGVGIDTGHAGQQIYYFETTPLGTRYQQANDDARYRPKWSAYARKSSGEWQAVLAIPLSALRLKSGKAEWRINFVRYVASSSEQYQWAYNGSTFNAPLGNGWPAFDSRDWALVPDLSFTAKALPIARPKVDFYALGTAGEGYNVTVQPNGEVVTQKPRYVGVDTTVPITPTINFVGTLYPDYTNVELDQQTIVPQEFPRVLTEYRPFFSQGANFVHPAYAFGGVNMPYSTIFYTPDIGVFNDGEKIEGTFGNQSLGLISFDGYNTLDGDAFHDQGFGYQHSVDQQAFSYWADGIMAHHSVLGNDGTIELGARHYDAKTGISWTADQSSESGSWINGSARDGYADFDVTKKYYVLDAAYIFTSPLYNPLDGFTAIADIKGPSAYGYLYGSDAVFKKIVIGVGADRFVDSTGASHEADTVFQFTGVFKNGFSIPQAGPITSELRGYGTPGQPCSSQIPLQYFSGISENYYCPQITTFNQMYIPLSYGDGTPNPTDAYMVYGKFGGNYTHVWNVTTSHVLWRKMTIAFQYAGTYERPLVGIGDLNSQWLRRLSIGYQPDKNTSMSIGLRDVNGTGGYAQPGLNLGADFHKRFDNGDLYFEYGAPAAISTLQRFIVKYVFSATGNGD